MATPDLLHPPKTVDAPHIQSGDDDELMELVAALPARLQGRLTHDARLDRVC